MKGLGDEWSGTSPYLESHQEVLHGVLDEQPLGDVIPRRRFQHLESEGERNDDSLPPRDEHDRLDADELPQGLDGREVLPAGVVKHDEAVDRPALAEVQHDGHVRVPRPPVEVPLPVQPPGVQAQLHQAAGSLQHHLPTPHPKLMGQTLEFGPAPPAPSLPPSNHSRVWSLDDHPGSFKGL